MLDASINLAELDRQTPDVLARGWRLLQPWRYAETDTGHVSLLLEAFAVPEGARVLDVGAGFGEVARLMAEQRPDLEFVLLNAVQSQLDHAPAEFEQVHGDAHDLPFEDGSFDAVMFHFALCNMDARVALAEASRVLRPGGVLLLNEPLRTEGDNAALEAFAQARAYPNEALVNFAQAFGLRLDYTADPECVLHYLRDADPEGFDIAFTGVAPRIWRFTREDVLPVAASVARTLARHDKIALQVSGGKDSLATLYLLRPWWDRLTVVWLDTGDAYPETTERMWAIAAEVPHFAVVQGRQPEIVSRDGWPSDVVPQRYTTDGNAVFGATKFKVQTRLSCCWRALMVPLHEAMQASGVTLLIRGKRRDEADKTGVETGYMEGGVEVLTPIIDWSEDDVFDFLERNHIEIPAFYITSPASLDCMSCTAWWEHKNGDYLEAHYPAHFAEHTRRLGLIRAAINEELKGLHHG
jgi:phosphoadenosine phosphosulfate reductase